MKNKKYLSFSEIRKAHYIKEFKLLKQYYQIKEY